MENLIGKRILNDTATIMGIYHPQYYDVWSFISREIKSPWDKKYPNWRDKVVIAIMFDKPNRVVTKEEFAEEYEMETIHVTDKLYEQYIPSQQFLTVPYDEIFKEVDNNGESV